MSRKYRIGIIGCGGTSGHFLSGVGAWPDRAEMSALCDLVPEQMHRRQEDFPQVCGQSALYTDYHKMLHEADLDIVCVCSYSDRHLEHAGDCMRAGKHVFVEKPVGYDLEESRRFKHLAGKHPELKVAVAYSLRYYRAFMDLKALIASGELGDIISCEISYSHGRHGAAGRDEAEAGASPAAPRRQHSRHPRRAPFEDRGGNYIASSELSHATHPWDLARYLLGEAREVFATSRPVEMGMLWMESGAICHVLAGAVRGAKIGYMQQQIVQVHGKNGSAWLTRDKHEPYAWRTHYKTDADIMVAPAVSDVPDSSHGANLRTKNLMDAIEGKAELICSLVDGTNTTDLLHAVWLSQRLQTKVPVLPANHSG